MWVFFLFEGGEGGSGGRSLNVLHLINLRKVAPSRPERLRNFKDPQFNIVFSTLSGSAGSYWSSVQTPRSEPLEVTWPPHGCQVSARQNQQDFATDKTAVTVESRTKVLRASSSELDLIKWPGRVFFK